MNGFSEGLRGMDGLSGSTICAKIAGKGTKSDCMGVLVVKSCLGVCLILRLPEPQCKCLLSWESEL